MTSSRILAIAFSIAVGVAGSARAADELWSFTDRVQQSQGIGQAGEVQEATTPGTAIPSEASSFFARVVESQGIDTRGSASSGTETQITSEATSFTSRVQESQGLGEYAEGAAAGEPSAR